MERPQADMQTKQREITGEIVYLDTMRQENEVPQPYAELPEDLVQKAEALADRYSDGLDSARPAIMDEYEQYDIQPSEVIASCRLLADELLALKAADNPFTFVDIVVDVSADTVLEKLQAITAGKALAKDDAQLAIPSNGEHYPILDFRKENAQLVGTGIRVWGWDYGKTVFTNKNGEPYEYPKHALIYPSNEKASTRQIELSFSYQDKDGQSFAESVSLYLASSGYATVSSLISSMAYAETGYEGHGGTSLDNVTDDDIGAFGDLVAEIVGDQPESVAMRIDRRLQELTEAAATPAAQQAIQDLVEQTWSAQANYFLHRSQQDSDKTIAQLLCDEATADTAIAAIDTIIKEWQAFRSK